MINLELCLIENTVKRTHLLSLIGLEALIKCETVKS